MESSQELPWRKAATALRHAAAAVLSSRDVAYGTRESVDADDLCLLGDSLLDYDATLELSSGATAGEGEN